MHLQHQIVARKSLRSSINTYSPVSQQMWSVPGMAVAYKTNFKQL